MHLPNQEGAGLADQRQQETLCALFGSLASNNLRPESGAAADHRQQPLTLVGQQRPALFGSLAGNYLRDEGATVLAKVLPECKNLTSLE